MFGLNKKHKKSKNDSNEGVFTGAVKQQKQSTTKKSSNVPDLICKVRDYSSFDFRNDSFNLIKNDVNESLFF